MRNGNKFEVALPLTGKLCFPDGSEPDESEREEELMSELKFYSEGGEHFTSALRPHDPSAFAFSLFEESEARRYTAVEYRQYRYDVPKSSPLYDTELVERIRAHARDTVGFSETVEDPLESDELTYDAWSQNGGEYHTVGDGARLCFQNLVLNAHEISEIKSRDWKLREMLEAMQERRDDFVDDFKSGGAFTSLLIEKASELDIIREDDFHAVSSSRELLLVIAYTMRESAQARRNNFIGRRPSRHEIWRECNEFVRECHLAACYPRNYDRIRAIEAWARDTDASEKPRLATARKWRARVARMALEMRVDGRIGKHAEPRFATWLSHAEREELSVLEMPRVQSFLDGYTGWISLASEFRTEWQSVNGTPAPAPPPAPSTMESDIDWFVNNT